MTITPEETRTDGLLPGAAIVVGIRSLLIWAVVAAVLLSSFVRGSMSGCSGGLDGSGGFIDSAGDPTHTVPRCGSVTMSASPLVYTAIALIVLLSLTRILRRADTVDAALRIVNNARMGIVVLTLVTFVVGYVAIMTVQVDDWSNYSLLSPFPFVSYEISTRPMGADG